MEIALYQPDVPQNSGTIMRLGACMGVPVHVIEPCGFPFSIKAVKRGLLDYGDHVELKAHTDWDSFDAWRKNAARRLVLLTTRADCTYTEFAYEPDDILMVGRESAGVPDAVHAAADARVLIPMRSFTRSINVATALSMVLGEALRQTGCWPKD